MNCNRVITNKRGQWRWRLANACAAVFVLQRFMRNDDALCDPNPAKTTELP